jgi:allantoate deiminase
MIELANKAIQCCRDLSLCTEEPGRITRTFLSPPMHDVHRILGDWMRRLGMQVRVDAVGNLRGVRQGSQPAPVLIGSHLDTVPNAGAFDGVLGVVLGIALIEALGNSAPTIEVVGFSEEEGVRFGIPFIGSRAMVGTLEPRPEIGDAIQAFGLDPNDLSAARMASRPTAYLEIHIEQGPVLDSLNLPLGVVDAIAGQSRLTFTFTGKANHAGTTPMPLRRDALAGAAEWICAVEAKAARTPGLVATIGSIGIDPNAANVIPGVARVSLDVRHACDESRRSAVMEMTDAARSICERRQIEIHYDHRLDQPAVAMDPRLRHALADSVQAAGLPVHRMISGAGHDAMILAPYMPAAMLFVRSPGGISHHPNETVIASDVAAAIDVGVRFIRCLTS